MAKESKGRKKKKTCFLVTPIGEPSSLTRKRVDQWESLVYKPVLTDKYRVVRADKISVPGKISHQVLDYLIDSDLVIIDLTDFNPNVMYESAIRHAAKKPWIQILPEDQNMPFDIKDFRVITYDPCDLEYPVKLKTKLKEMVKSVNSRAYKAPSLIEYQFDFDRIFNDPERFVELLRKHFTPISSEGPANVVKVIDSNIYSFGYSQQRIVCPKCKVIARTTPSDWTVSSVLQSMYKCENCGTEFEA